MTIEELSKLEVGDIVQHVSSGEGYVIIENLGDTKIAVRAITCVESARVEAGKERAMRTTFEEAAKFAIDAHVSQFDKCGMPYILHPLRVAAAMDTYEEKIVAVLHDVLEDTPVTYVRLAKEFGLDIANGVVSVSRGWILRELPTVMVFSPPEPVEIGRYDKELYFDFIHRAKQHPVGRKVKIADIKDNSLPERVACLPEAERGITKRYEKALKILTEV